MQRTGLAVLVLAAVGLAVLMGIVGWSAVRQNWANGDPWFAGFQLAPLTTPLAAFIAAGVAITTARWGLHSAKATREKDHQRWEADRDAERQRWTQERQSENARRHIERRDATERTLRDRFHELVKLLASEDLRAREGAAYAVVALADDWKAHYDDDDPFKARAEQQVCINVLIAQLRDPLPASMIATDRAHLAAFKQVVQKLIGSRLGKTEEDGSQPGRWSSFEFVFDGCTFHNFDLHQRVLSGANVSFDGARFSGERTSFNGAQFSGERTSFDGAQFTSKRVSFDRVQFTGWRVSFLNAQFTSQQVSFRRAQFAAELVWFASAQFAGEHVTFHGAQFSGMILFDDAQFTARQVSFYRAAFTGRRASFRRVHFAGTALGFRAVHFASGQVSFRDAHFAGHDVMFNGAQFTGDQVSFSGATFANETVSFDDASFTGRGKSVDFTDAIASFGRSELFARTGGYRLDDDGARFNVGPLDFPECEVCGELAAAMQYK